MKVDKMKEAACAITIGISNQLHQGNRKESYLQCFKKAAVILFTSKSYAFFKAYHFMNFLSDHLVIGCHDPKRN